MENIKMWQYVAIGGAGFMFGIFVTYLYFKEYVAGLEDIILRDEPEPPLSTEEITKRFLDQL